MADHRLFDLNSRPNVFINWTSFTDQGIPNDWQWPFTDAVMNACTRWMTMAGAAIRFRFAGFTDRTSADGNEVVITMNERHFNESRIASAFGKHVVFHRRNGANMTEWPFVPYNAAPGEIDMQGVLMHELGHTHWLDHSSSDQETMWGAYAYAYRYGPFEGDAQRVKALYGDFNNNRLRLFRSSDGGATWARTATEITSYNHHEARTTNTPAVAPIGRFGLYTLQWSHPSRIPTWLRNDGPDFLFNPWLYGGERAVNGHAVASDGDRRLLWAWVTNDNALPLRLVGSDDAGSSWFSLNPPAGAASIGTPGLAFTRVGGTPTWVLVWAHFDRADEDAVGRLRASTSTNGGASWTTPVELSTTSRALAGVGVAAAPDGRILIGFANAPRATNAMNAVRFFRAGVTGGNVTVQAEVTGPAGTRLQPAVAYHPPSNRFVYAYREQNYLTSLRVGTLGWGDASFAAGQQLPDSSTNVAPALACSPTSNELCLWYAFEGA